MIIDIEKKYIFIGLPYSASSAITKELIEQYSGQSILHKHANIPLLKKMTDINLSEYIVFAVVRDPVEIAFSMYNKFLSNPFEIYTNPKYFKENGGFVKKNARAIYKAVQKKAMTFEEYLLYVYNIFPYDNDLSINEKYITHTINFNNLVDDFKICLDTIGTKQVRDLPVYNKTKKMDHNMDVSKKVVLKIFLPFYVKNKRFFKKKYKINFLLNIYFKIYQTVRYFKRLKYDLHFMNSAFSIDDLKNKR